MTDDTDFIITITYFVTLLSVIQMFLFIYLKNNNNERDLLKIY